MTWTPDAIHFPDLRTWRIDHLRIDGRRRFVARRLGITYIFAELEDRSYRVTKIRGGQILDEREFASMPRNLHAVLDHKRRRQSR